MRCATELCSARRPLGLRRLRRIWTWGRGREGQLGRGVGENADPIAEDLDLGAPVSHVAAGLFHSLVVTTDGMVHAFGRGAGGRLGTGTADDAFSPHACFRVQGDEVVSLAAGGSHSGLVTRSGAVFTWGYDGNGQVGAVQNDGPLPACSDFENLDPWVIPTARADTLQKDGELWVLRPTPLEVPGLAGSDGGDTAVALSCGGSHSALTTTSGALYTWGRSDLGRLGHPDAALGSFAICQTSGVTEMRAADRVPRRVEALDGEHVVQVSCGGFHTACVTASGEVFTFGGNGNGELGLGSDHGQGAQWRPTRVQGRLAGQRVVRVSCGGYHTAALTDEGRVFAWGANHKGQLGVGSDALCVGEPLEVQLEPASRCVWLACGALFTCAVVTSSSDDNAGDSRLMGFGDSYCGQLGGTAHATDVLERVERRPVVVSSRLPGASACRVACGAAHVLAWPHISTSGL